MSEHPTRSARPPTDLTSSTRTTQASNRELQQLEHQQQRRLSQQSHGKSARESVTPSDVSYDGSAIYNDEEDDDDDDNFSRFSHGSKFSRAGHKKKQMTSSEQERHDQAVREVQAHVKAEHCGVQFWRGAVLVLMLAMAAVLSTVVFRALNLEQEDDFQGQYDVITDSVAESLVVRRDQLYRAARSLAEQVATQSVSLSNVISGPVTREAEFPYAYVPDLEVAGASALGISQDVAEFAVLAPLVPNTPANRTTWIDFTKTSVTDEWRTRSIDYVVARNPRKSRLEYRGTQITPDIYRIDPRTLTIDASSADASNANRPWVAPVWQTTPPPVDPQIINYNLLDPAADLAAVVDALNQTRVDTTTALWGPTWLDNNDDDDVGESSLNLARTLGSRILRLEDHRQRHQEVLVREEDDRGGPTAVDYYNQPFTSLVQPVETNVYRDQSVPSSAPLVAIWEIVVAWDVVLAGLLPDDVTGITVVVRNSCDQAFTYELVGTQVAYLGPDDFHERGFDSTEVIIPFYQEEEAVLIQSVSGHCMYSVHLYASTAFEEIYKSNQAVVWTIISTVGFALLLVFVFICDRFVRLRNTKVLDEAAKAHKLVQSLFPKAVRSRLVDGEEDPNDVGFTENDLRKFLEGGGTDEFELNDEDEINGDPIADLYPETTIMFADIAGFTAWSSKREPVDVFRLLEGIYNSFDQAAKRRGVYKVETIGDCYVAVAGLPDPMSDHALVMCKFARDCRVQMHQTISKLSATLGTDTLDLDMRFGLHSGPVTAGVLRGERARFQLFGDTMNTASRVETTGMKGRIHLSEDTAHMVRVYGKTHWLVKRKDKVQAKGKGTMQTYWLKPAKSKADNKKALEQEKALKNADGLSDSSHEIASLGETRISYAESSAVSSLAENSLDDKTARLIDLDVDILMSGLEEVVRAHPEEYLEDLPASQKSMLAGFLSKMSRNSLQEDAKQPLREEVHSLVRAINGMSADNPSSNFTLASLSILHVSKLLTNGNSMDALPPILTVACLYASLCRNLAHPGVSNAVLEREGSAVHSTFKGKSVREQLAADLGLKLLNDSPYGKIRRALFRSDQEQKQFTEAVSTFLMAMDIADPKIQEVREAQWFRIMGTINAEKPARDISLEASNVVGQQIVQSGFLCHRMEVWDIFKKWTIHAFDEAYHAFIAGRIPVDPAVNFVEDELHVFDTVVLPLCRKLQTYPFIPQKVADRNLKRALRNRTEWSNQGPGIVARLVESIRNHLEEMM